MSLSRPAQLVGLSAPAELGSLGKSSSTGFNILLFAQKLNWLHFQPNPTEQPNPVKLYICDLLDQLTNVA